MQDYLFPELMATFGQNLTLRREELGLSRKEMAKRLGVPTSQVINWEKDRYSPNVKTALRILKGYELPIEDAVCGTDTEYDALVNKNNDIKELSEGRNGRINHNHMEGHAQPDERRDPPDRHAIRSGESERASDATDQSSAPRTGERIPQAVLDQMATIQTALRDLGGVPVIIKELQDIASELRHLGRELHIVQDVIAEKAAAWAMASPDQQRPTTNLVVKATRPRVPRQHERQTRRKPRG